MIDVGARSSSEGHIGEADDALSHAKLLVPSKYLGSIGKTSMIVRRCQANKAIGLLISELEKFLIGCSKSGERN